MPGVYPRQLFGEKAEKSNISSSFLPAPLAYELFPRAGSAGLLPKDSSSFCFSPEARRIGGEGTSSPSVRNHDRSLKDAPSAKNKWPQPESGGHGPSARLPGSATGLLPALACPPKQQSCEQGWGPGAHSGRPGPGSGLWEDSPARSSRPIPQGPSRKEDASPPRPAPTRNFPRPEARETRES